MKNIEFNIIREEEHFAMGIDHIGGLYFLEKDASSSCVRTPGGTYTLDNYDGTYFEELALDDYLETLRAPMFATLFLTKKCNLKCHFCATERYCDQDEMTLEKVKKTIDELAEMKVFGVVFTGGEPFMHQNIVEILNYSASKKMIVIVKSNGTLFSEEMIKKIVPEVHFSLSIDGLKEKHENTRGVNTYNKLIKSVELLKRYGRDVNLHYTITRDNFDDLYPVLDYCIENDIILTSDPVINIGDAEGNEDILLTDEQVKNYFEFKKHKRKRYRKINNRVAHQLSIADADILNPLFNSCEGLKGTLHIDSNGDVYPCTTCCSVGYGKVGNLNDDTMATIWNSESSSKIRGNTYDKFTECHSCRLDNDCNFKCMALAYAKNENPTGCGSNRVSMSLCQLSSDDAERYSKC